MILNGYTVLDAFLSLLRFGLGALVLLLAVSALRGWYRRWNRAGGFSEVENRCHLLFLLAGVLLVLNVASWPIFYLLLQSYVPEWPNVMCIYGVTRIGAESLSSSRFLPALVTALQTMKPALVFLSGAWFVLHLVNRRTRTAPLTGRILVLLLLMGLLVVADAATELTYLAIPKKEVFLSTGCCTEVFDADQRISRLLPRTILGEEESRWYAVYYALNVAMVLGLMGCGRRCRQQLPTGWLAILFPTAILSLLVNVGFLIEIAAPRLLHLPGHHCPYDLVPKAPESLVAVALFFAGSFSVGWAFVVGQMGNHPEAGPFLQRLVEQLCRLGILGYLWSVLMMSVELALT